MATASPSVIYDASRLTDHDVYLFKEGNHSRLHEKLGSHVMEVGGAGGTHFAVWAPNAASVSVIGDFNDWNLKSHPLKVRGDGSGIWEGFIPGLGPGTLYKYHLLSRAKGYQVEKGDPFAFCWECPPRSASVVWDLNYEWGDADWLAGRKSGNALQAPMSIYEVHLGSWRRAFEEEGRFLTYQEMALVLPDYVSDMGFTHVEFLPTLEHPFYGSWGYQTAGYFAPTRRYGTPNDFKYLVDQLHLRGVGVILDWVPSHFPSDEYALSYFDGTHLYEHADPRKGFHPDWKSFIFNYGRHEVRAFLISSAVFWLSEYHFDGLRVDAVASMLYLDYSRKEGEWIANEFGGNENIEAIRFLRGFNETVYTDQPGIETIAEESTAWPMVSKPGYVGGLGFGMKWNMGWMHDTLDYFSRDPVYRKHHHDQLTFSIWYAFMENFVLPLSHDEVVHGKGSLLEKMPGDDWQKFANLRLLLGYMYAHPGKKLLFMGAEIGQRSEWDHESQLDWHLLEHASHQGIQNWVRDLNHCYRSEPALSELDFSTEGFEWVDFRDWEQCVISFLRKSKSSGDLILVVCNFTPVPRHGYRTAVPRAGQWKELLNSDAECYGGSGHGNSGLVEGSNEAWGGKEHSLTLTLPPLGLVFLKSKGPEVASTPEREGAESEPSYRGPPKAQSEVKS